MQGGRKMIDKKNKILAFGAVVALSLCLAMQAMPRRARWRPITLIRRLSRTTEVRI